VTHHVLPLPPHPTKSQEKGRSQRIDAHRLKVLDTLLAKKFKVPLKQLTKAHRTQMDKLEWHDIEPFEQDPVLIENSQQKSIFFITDDEISLPKVQKTRVSEDDSGLASSEQSDEDRFSFQIRSIRRNSNRIKLLNLRVTPSEEPFSESVS
jgi:hypothetical protein